ncbi:MAG: glycosyltransferase family 8 protein [Paraprevotella sp.]|nr:glycosyltransferase family 8 protein [Paraprevotella sp.]
MEISGGKPQVRDFVSEKENRESETKICLVDDGRISEWIIESSRMEDGEMIKVALCTDTYYMMACGPCVVSIFEHHRKTPCHIYVITKELPQEDVDGLKYIAARYGVQLTLKTIDSDFIQGLKVNERFRESVYYRFLLPNLFPEEKKMLYLDCDTLVNGSLRELWETDIDGYACAVVEDQEADDITLKNRIGVYDTTYFNSGVLLINMDYWRIYHVARRLVDFIREHPSACLFPYQDALNAVLHDEMKYLPYGYNYQDLWYTCDYQWLRLHASKFKEVERWKKNPVVVYFAGGNKPWQKDCSHPFAKYYLECLSKTPWTVARYKKVRKGERASLYGERSKMPHKYIRRFNRLLLVFIIETIAFFIYLLCLQS